MGAKGQKEIYPSKEKKGMKIFCNVNYLDYLYNIIKQQINNQDNEKSNFILHFSNWINTLLRTIYNTNSV